ncbi:hypothetical protein OBBRIDRAFT_829312 [Obba rivulosa]|uniref:MYND-type domain-containing protein n=1 Tax=Obba rivulosa TaxID=1052685 RepID=A0A8E2DFA5_9APHY|nr:hypothetical protein OBBRIDRAFT_829312 [Obba rivulosa]
MAHTDIEHELYLDMVHGKVPATDKKRHPNSDPDEKIRKLLTQCQYCFKSRGHEVKLYRCSECSNELYCSKQCQTAAWPSHKKICKRSRLPEREANKRKALNDFIRKHSYTIAVAGTRALELWLDFLRAERDVLLIFLRSRPGSPRPEKAFYCVEATEWPIDEFSSTRAAAMRSSLQLGKEVNARNGAVGTVLVVVQCMDADEPVSTVVPVCFYENVQPMHPETPWREWMMTRLNEGIAIGFRLMCSIICQVLDSHGVYGAHYDEGTPDETERSKPPLDNQELVRFSDVLAANQMRHPASDPINENSTRGRYSAITAGSAPGPT